MNVQAVPGERKGEIEDRKITSSPARGREAQESPEEMQW